MKELIKKLHDENCSLVVQAATGEVTTYNKKGVRDLVWLLDHEAWRMSGASIADKVIGKAAAGLVVRGGVKELYAEVMSRLALPLLDGAGIHYSYGELVDRIIIPAVDNRCPLEKIVASAQTAEEVEQMLREHFSHQASIGQT